MVSSLHKYLVVISRPIVILNPAAGTAAGEIGPGALSALFREFGKEPHVLVARGPAGIRSLASKAVAENAEAVVAAGGDGTVSAVAGVLAHTAVPLGVLPVGTFNHFARDLGLPTGLEDALRVIAENQISRVDVGEVNGRIFINNSSLGLYPLIVSQREKRRRMGYGKWLAFPWAVLSALRHYPLLGLRLEVEGRELRRRTAFAFVGNNLYRLEGLRLGSRSSLSDGSLCLYVTHRTGRLGVLALSLSALLGRLTRSQSFDAFRASEIWIESRVRHLRVALDGEVAVMESPLHYRVLPGALRVIVPRLRAS